MAGTGTAAEPGTGWADLRHEVATAVTALRDTAPSGAAVTVLADLTAQVTRIAWDEEIAGQRAAREYDRGFAAGLAARRVPRHRAGPRPRWLRAVS